MEKEIELENEAATLAFGGALARATFVNRRLAANQLESGVGTQTIGAVVHLQGDLGAGKTTLARGFMRGFGVQGAIKSPTYTLVEPYELALCQLYHFDLYRLGDPGELEYLGFDDYFSETSVCIVEWPCKGRGFIPMPDLTIEIQSSGTGRTLICQTFTEKGLLIGQSLWP